MQKTGYYEGHYRNAAFRDANDIYEDATQSMIQITHTRLYYLLNRSNILRLPALSLPNEKTTSRMYCKLTLGCCAWKMKESWTSIIQSASSRRLTARIYNHSYSLIYLGTSPLSSLQWRWRCVRLSSCPRDSGIVPEINSNKKMDCIGWS